MRARADMESASALRQPLRAAGVTLPSVLPEGLTARGAVARRSRVAAHSLCRYDNIVRISYDPAKREKTLTERGLDFQDAIAVFRGLIELHPAWLGSPRLQHAKGKRSWANPPRTVLRALT
jgi:hypothetical protein